MKLAEEALKKIGYDVVPVKFDQAIFKKASWYFMGMVANNMINGTIRDFKIEGETMLKPLQNNTLILTSTGPKRYLIDFLLKYVLNKRRAFDLLNGLRVRSDPVEYEKFLKERFEFVFEVSELWQKLGITALVMPIWPHCAVESKNYEALGMVVEYSLIWNVVGFPSGVLPVTKVLESE